MVRPAEEDKDTRYSLMQVPEDPRFYAPPKDGNEYAHVGSLDGSDVGDIKLPTAQSKRYGSYIVRAPPSSRQRASTHFNVRSTSAMRHHSERRSPKPHRESKHLEILDPLVEESLHRSLSQQNRLSCVVTPTKVKTRRTSASPPSEKRQRRTLSRFTKELERYCVAASTNGRAPLPPSTPTVSESPTTLDTVTELLPYHKQFKIAGLAVTSREQMPRIPESVYPPFPPRHAGRVRGINAAAVQIDGSSVTPSDQVPIAQKPTAPAVPDKEEVGSSNPPPPGRASQPQSKAVTKSLLPWFLKQNPSFASTTHSGRKISKNHMHPSQATPAEPVLTPLGLIDSYFDSPQPPEPQNEQHTGQNSSSTSAVSSIVSSHTDKPLPKQPPIVRRPIPPRSERRHMENTAEWPTAGVLIHDNSPPTPSRAESACGILDQAVPANESSSAHSWTIVDDDLPNEPERSPPVPPKEIDDSIRISAEAGFKPLTPPKDDPPKESEARQGHHHNHPGHSLYHKWMKATCIRRRASVKRLAMPTTIREESETPAEDPKNSQQAASGPNDVPPRLSVDLPFLVETPSSFERALDAVISKLDAMEERRRYERKMDLEAARRALNKSNTSQQATSKVTTPTASTSGSEHPASDAALETAPSPETTIERSDKDINDRDILLGLKMAICAACDEDLDAWICNKTGLRLRRFLADLKAFDSVSQDRKQSQLLPMSRQIRRSEEENRRLQAEQQRRKRNSKPWSPCFGGDGQGSLAEAGKDALRDPVPE